MGLLRRHMKKNHEENKTPYHVCHDCQINFESQKKVKEHFSMVHGRNQVSSQDAKTAKRKVKKIA